MNTRASKDEQIRWMNALNNASVLVASLSVTKDDVVPLISAFANEIFLIEPGMSDLGTKISAAKTLEELDTLKDSVRDTDKVSLFQLWNDKKIALTEQQNVV